ncbi:hypothetical protein GQ53DRAFT_758113 [Thozetella sp. PMI_491]|nr:hypothetical protein GQ53DRAFT_758113 [Thozetella sp. PMI_491]
MPASTTLPSTIFFSFLAGVLMLYAGAARAHRSSAVISRQALTNCLENSGRVNNLTLIYTRTLDGGPAGGEDSMIYFQLGNPALGVDAQCSAHGPTLAPSGTDNTLFDPGKWYNCFVESRDPSIDAVFRFDSVQTRLTVNETWACQDEKTDTMVPFQAYGSTKMPLICSGDKASQTECHQDSNPISISVSVTRSA